MNTVSRSTFRALVFVPVSCIMDPEVPPAKKKKTVAEPMAGASSSSVLPASSSAPAGNSSAPAGNSSAQAGNSSAPTGSSPEALETLAAASEEVLPHLCCSVCLSFPEASVFQCDSGHIMCHECHGRVCAEDKPTCPSCRMVLDPVKPIRNVVVEQSIALLPVACPNEGCHAKCTRGSLQAHTSAECPYRTVSCKYAPLGCKWEGLARSCQRHEDKCKKAELPGWKLLKKVEEVQAKRVASERQETDSSAAVNIANILSGRCRNLEVSHVVLHKCSAHEHVGGRPAHLASAAFHCLGFRFKLFTLHDPTAGCYQLALQLRDSRTPLPLDFFVVRAPATDARVRAVTASHTFDRRAARTSEPITIAQDDAASALSDFDSLVLRVGIADRRTGRLSRDFLGQPSSVGGYEGDERSPYGSEEDAGSDEGDGIGGSSDESFDSEDVAEGMAGPRDYYFPRPRHSY